jgi:hypothetical protein
VSAGEDVEMVRVRFRFRPYERMVYTLLFGRLCQVLTIVGAVLIAFSFVPAPSGYAPIFLVLGLGWLLGFVWQPYAEKLKSVRRSYTATAEGFAWDIEDYGTGKADWRAFGGSRRFIGALLLEQPDCPPIVIPRRALAPGQLEVFERLAQAGCSSDVAHGDLVPPGAGEPALSFEAPSPGFGSLVRIKFGELGPSLLLAAGFFGVLTVLYALAGFGELAVGMAALGVVVATTPVPVVLIGMIRRPRDAAVFRVTIYPSGYALSGPQQSWVPWTTFGRAAETRDAVVLHIGRSRNHVHLWTATLTNRERLVLRSVLAGAGLLPGQAR